MTKKEILEAVELYHKTGKAIFEGDALCFKTLTFEEVKQNKREAGARRQQGGEEEVINYLRAEDRCDEGGTQSLKKL